MKKKLDHLLVVDIESTCWEDKPPDGQQNEIIEIGVCVLSLKNLNIVTADTMLVRPENSTVSDFCTSLTTLTQEMVDGGISFSQACSDLKSKYNSQNRTWASWGDYDRRQFERQCGRVNVKYPFGITHLNLKNLFAIQLGLAREVGMDTALQMLDFDLEGTHHRACDDAKNIAKIASDILNWGERPDQRSFLRV